MTATEELPLQLSSQCALEKLEDREGELKTCQDQRKQKHLDLSEQLSKGK